MNDDYGDGLVKTDSGDWLNLYTGESYKRLSGNYKRYMTFFHAFIEFSPVLNSLEIQVFLQVCRHNTDLFNVCNLNKQAKISVAKSIKKSVRSVDRAISSLLDYGFIIERDLGRALFLVNPYMFVYAFDKYSRDKLFNDDVLKDVFVSKIHKLKDIMNDL